MQVLVVDDDDFSLSVLDNTLARMGYTAVTAHDGKEALETLRRSEIRLVITDWDMPNMNGIELCRTLRRQDLAGYVYVIMLTGREGSKQRLEGLCAGADDFLNKPLDPEELLVCLKTAERILSLETRDLALFALAKLAESRDTDAGAHIERVQSYARLIAQHLSPEVKAFHGVDEEFIRLLFQTSPLHDLGKVGIPDAVLLKPGELTADEFAIMKTHTIVGAQTLDSALQRFPNARFLQMAREIAATHHEKFNGTGYPKGLVGEQIPLSGRIVAVADVYDTLTSKRVYKEASTHGQAMAVLLRDRGSHFDPEVVDAFARAEQLVISERERLRDNDEVHLPQEKPMPALPAPCQGGPDPCKILVAEDNPLILKKLTQILAATGEPVFTANDGQEAYKLMQEQSPRVVVSDWVMPEMDGVELCRRIRSRAKSAPVHFIMLTAHSDKSRLLDAYSAGVDDFVTKPFDPEELLARVRAGIRAAKLHDDLVRKATGSQALNSQLATLNSRLERLNITDELTGVFNRRHAMTSLQEAWASAEREGGPLSMAMIDIDRFKSVNDTYGHDAGDAILRRVAGVLRDQTRGTDTVCRVGGEEFLIIFPAQTTREAHFCAERCRAAVEAETFKVRGTSIKATISIGLAARERGMTQFGDALRAADQALYAAKKAGRNTIRFADEVESAQPDPKASGSDFAVTPAVATGTVIDLEAVLKRCGGDPTFAAAVMEMFRAQACGEVEKIEQALASGDKQGLRRAAHNLKGTAAYVAATSASELASRIEEIGYTESLVEIPALLTQLKEEVERATALLTKKNEPADQPVR